MKKNKYVLLSVAVIAFMLSFVSSCKEEEPVNMAPVLDMNGTGEIMRQTAVLYGSITGNMTHVESYGFQYSLSEKFPSDQSYFVKVDQEEMNAGEFLVTVTGLKPNTRYFYRAYATTGATEVYSYYDNFTTLSSSAPVVYMWNIEDVGEDYVTCSCQIEDVGDEYLYEYGVQYRKAKSTDPFISVMAENIAPDNRYEVKVTGLSAETEYEFRPYAQNSDTSDGKNGFRVGYGNVTTEKTERQQSAVVKTESIDDANVGITSITVTGMVEAAPGSGGTVDECGFCYSETSPTPNLADETVTVDFPGLEKYYKATITGLSMNTTYYVRAYAKNTVDGESRVGFGEVFQITTKSLSVPVISWVYNDEWGTPAESTVNSIHAVALIDNYEQGLLQEKGLVWSKTKPNITLDEAKTEKTVLTIDSEDQKIDGTITGLEVGEYYYVRAYAVFKVGEEVKTGYSTSVGINTENLKSATLTGLEASDITFQSANLSCVVASEGNGTIKEKGFLVSKYYEESNPSLTDTRFTTKYVVDGVEFSAVAQDLEYSTYYVMRAYVITELAGQTETVYSGYCYFSTEAIKEATFYNTTVDGNSRTYHSLTVSGGIKDLGDGELLEKGFYWYKSGSGFENRDSLAVSTGTSDEFSLTIDSLLPNAYYYVGTYVKKKAGNYEIVSRASTTGEYTKNIAGATFSSVTFDGDSITYHSLYVKSGIKDLGDGELLEKGFYWYESNSSFEERDSMAVSTGTNADFALTIDGLRPDTYYYVRSYAKKKVGDKEMISYSSSSEKRTNQFTLPFSSLSTDSVSYSSFIVKSGITAVSEGTLVEKGFCWRQGGTPTLDNNLGSVKIEDGTVDAFSYKIEGLIPNRSYYVRAYAKVKVGETVYVAYGDYSYVYTRSLGYNVSWTPYDTTCDMEISFSDGEAPVSGINVYVTDDYYKSGSYTSNPTLSELTKYTLTKDENANKFTGTLDQLTQSTQYYYHIYYLFDGEEIRLGYGSFSTGRVPSIDDAVSPDKKE